MPARAVPAIRPGWRTGVLVGVLGLSACATPSGLDPFAAPPPVASDAIPTAPQEPAAHTAAVADGRYAGLSILTAFHGDCNAGGTGEIVVRGMAVTYRDARNPGLSGRLGTGGEVDVATGRTRLTGRFAAGVFTGRIAGGPCEYQMRFERVPG